MVAIAKVTTARPLPAAHVLDAGDYRSEVDGLRGIAVVAVVAFHAFPNYFPGGYVGVDVFFVISGFLITNIILRQLQRSTFTLAKFYARRIRRIFPALIVVLSACVAIGGIALLPDELTELGKHIASAAVFLSNFTLLQESGYFDRAAELKPLLHLWSLGVEEQFYLLWPVVLLVLIRRPPRQLLMYVLALTLLSLACALVLARIHPIANFYLPVSRFWELGLGCLIAIAKYVPATGMPFGLRRAQLSSRTHSSLAILGVALIAFAIFVFDRHTTFPGLAALVPTLGSAFVIIAGSNAWFQRRILGSFTLVGLGLISYPLYLWHWPLLSFTRIVEAGEPALSARIVAIVTSLILAWGTYLFIERPIRAARGMRNVFVLVIALALIGATGYSIYAARGFAERFDDDVRALRPEPRLDETCKRRFPERETFNYCKSTTDQAPAVMVLGDSRAHALYDGIVAATQAREPMILLARGGCPPLLDVPLHYNNEKRCNDAWRFFVEQVSRLRPAAVVLVGGGADLMDASVARLDASDGAFSTHEAAFRHGLRELVTALEATSRVIYVMQFPQFETEPSCFLRRIRLPGTDCAPTIARRDVEAQTATYRRVVREVQAQRPNLTVVDSLDTLCEATKCAQTLRSGRIAYSDSLHLSTVGGHDFAVRSGMLALLFPRASRPEHSPAP
jgi:peptidoglycan/LPS O-acetylase OafA/YrhL